MRNKLLTGIAAAAATVLTLASCRDDVSNIGPALAPNEVTITVDSLVTDLGATSIYYDSFDGRNITKLLGRLNVPEYGRLDCSFVSQMLCAGSMSIPDSISEEEVDSMRLVLSIPRGGLTGDSLAPQQLRVYRLDKQLPDGITSSFNPDGYYSASNLMGSASYAVSNIAKGDSALKNEAYVRVPVMMPREFCIDLFRKYRANDPMFEWPATFNQYFPGIYVEQNFGNGCVANIAKAEFWTYWHAQRSVSVMQPDSTYAPELRTYRDSVCLLASMPEVLSSNIISYKVSDYLRDVAASDKSVITTPGGYMVDIRFPIRELIDRYNSQDAAMSVVSRLQMEIPATEVKNDYGITVAPYLLMVKKGERESFFNENKIPDGSSSFYAAYDATTGSYHFDAMRTYFLRVLEAVAKGEEISEEDMDFTLVPVDIERESVSNYDGSVVYYVTRCMPYIYKPTMTLLSTDKALVTFTYSSQQID